MSKYCNIQVSIALNELSDKVRKINRSQVRTTLSTLVSFGCYSRCHSGRDLLIAIFLLSKTKQREVEAAVEC
jgi:hypothetical protein